MNTVVSRCKATTCSLSLPMSSIANRHSASSGQSMHHHIAQRAMWPAAFTPSPQTWTNTSALETLVFHKGIASGTTTTQMHF